MNLCQRLRGAKRVNGSHGVSPPLERGSRIRWVRSGIVPVIGNGLPACEQRQGSGHSGFSVEILSYRVPTW